MALVAAPLLGTPQSPYSLLAHTVPGHACGPRSCINSAPFLSPSGRRVGPQALAEAVSLTCLACTPAFPDPQADAEGGREAGKGHTVPRQQAGL